MYFSFSPVCNKNVFSCPLFESFGILPLNAEKYHRDPKRHVLVRKQHMMHSVDPRMPDRDNQKIKFNKSSAAGATVAKIDMGQKRGLLCPFRGERRAGTRLIECGLG